MASALSPSQLQRGLAQVTIVQQDSGPLELTLKGTWSLHQGWPSPDTIVAHCPMTKAGIVVRCELEQWDSSLTSCLHVLQERARQQGCPLHLAQLPQGVAPLLELAQPREHRGQRDTPATPGRLQRLGTWTLARLQGGYRILALCGALTQSAVRLVRGRLVRQPREWPWLLQDCGANALPIVSLIAVLVGMILAFVGALQLERFGAQIYIADLVGLGMAREMGAMMSAVIMAGRTGAAFAAQLGTMEANEELDALRTFGIDITDVLILPRLTALAVMLPLLTLYADALGILGGALIGIGPLDLTPEQYWQQTKAALTPTHVAVGVIKALVFAKLIALCGCYHGIYCGRNAQAVGQATTRAVVSSIIAIVVADALLTYIFSLLGI